MPLPTAVEVAPSILAADFACLGDAIRAVEQGGVSTLHVDVMDGHFVPNISIGVPVVASLRKATRLTLDVHLMIQKPEQYVRAFAEAGADMISVHQEATVHLDSVLTSIRDAGCRAKSAPRAADMVAFVQDRKTEQVLKAFVDPTRIVLEGHSHGAVAVLVDSRSDTASTVEAANRPSEPAPPWKLT